MASVRVVPMNNKHVPNSDALNAARTMVLALLLILTGSVILNIGFIVGGCP